MTENEPTTGELARAVNALYSSRRIYITDSGNGDPAVKVQRLKQVITMGGKIVSIEWEDEPEVDATIKGLVSSVQTFNDWQTSLKQTQNISISGELIVTDSMRQIALEMAEEHRKLNGEE